MEREISTLGKGTLRLHLQLSGQQTDKCVNLQEHSGARGTVLTPKNVNSELKEATCTPNHEKISIMHLQDLEIHNLCTMDPSAIINRRGNKKVSPCEAQRVQQLVVYCSYPT